MTTQNTDTTTPTLTTLTAVTATTATTETVVCKLAQMVNAEQAGKDWAKGLKAGEQFLGAGPVARARYYNRHEVDMFIDGALDVLNKNGGRVRTDTNGKLLEAPYKGQ